MEDKNDLNFSEQSIFKLPPELIESFVSYTTYEEFLNLRTSCRFFKTSLHYLLLHRIQQKKVKQVASGLFHTVVLRLDGTVMVSGWNTRGQLGTGDIKSRSSFTKLDLVTVDCIATSSTRTFFLKKDGTVLACGSNDSGELGIADTKTCLLPTQIPSLTDIKQITCSENVTLFLKRDGSAWACGRNYFKTNFATPTEISNLNDVIQIASSACHRVILCKDGTVWSYGLNRSGQLGIGNTNDCLYPTKIPDLSDIKQIASTASSTLFLKQNGTVWVCGDNTHGQLGIGNAKEPQHFRMILKPMQFPDFYDVVQVAASSDNGFQVSTRTLFLFLKKDGTVWGCGSNNSDNQLGADPKFNCYGVKQIMPMAEVEQVIASNSYSLFIKKDGMVWGCGYLKEMGLNDHHLLAPIPLKPLNKWHEVYQTFSIAANQANENQETDDAANEMIPNIPSTHFI